MGRRVLKTGLPLVAMLALWIAADYALTGSSSLRRFDGHEVGRLETAMWRSYYGHNQLKLFGQLTALLREQYHMPFWPAMVGAYHAARAAAVFQDGHNRAEYELALPGIVSLYGLIRRVSDVPFDVEKTARLELEWWIVHRERDRYGIAALEQSLAALQAELYQRPANLFAWHARARASAMLIRDRHAEVGSVTEADWETIARLLDSSWVSLQTAVSR